MRTIFLSVLVVFVMTGCKSKKSAVAAKPKNEIETNKRIPISEADPIQKQRAYDFGTRILNACNTSRFRPFTSNEATPAVINNISESKLTKTCLKFRLKYGDFKDLDLQEIIPNKKEETTVYRYKAEYTKKIANKELRVVMNKDNKLVAIKSTDWKDKYEPLK
ncbi:hypothetical protein [Flavobacterium silvaticum]|uniref:Lipoprotein n=1 Tax=Flavobacterium silvaticum TaxID=1852020 RepID=A0A972FNY3_9FLAO|nr:hypothetical protein [Flavobacterium silvaticum]NMH29162.1 hypothetical protein [Flavobacterium silvaticum]